MERKATMKGNFFMDDILLFWGGREFWGKGVLGGKWMME